VLIRSGAGRGKGWIVEPRSKLISGIGICTTYCGIFSHEIKELLWKCLFIVSVQGVGSLMSFRRYLSLLGAEPALLRWKGWIVEPRSKLIPEIGICTTYCGVFS
jgi:hypothetical protein